MEEFGKAFECFLAWTESLRRAVSGEIVALDGKALRRAMDQSGGRALPYMVSAWATDNGLALGQVEVDEKSNEITAIPVLLRSLELAGCIVTIDAMGCPKKIAREIVDADADYVLALKGNQETVHDGEATVLTARARARLWIPDDTEVVPPSLKTRFIHWNWRGGLRPDRHAFRAMSRAWRSTVHCPLPTAH